jgi:hypothetical protein
LPLREGLFYTPSYMENGKGPREPKGSSKSKQSAGRPRGKSAPRTGSKARTKPAKTTPRAAEKAAPGKPTPSRATERSAPRKPEAPKTRAPRSRTTRGARPPVGVPLTEEEQIGRAKFGTVPPQRLFEEERFLFPESYGRNQVRLLVRDPQWLFAYFDVDPRTLGALAQELGERTLALSRVALRVSDPGNGGTSMTLLPPGARSWYVQVDDSRRSYTAELGLLLPSGVFKHLATSNTVATPHQGPAAEPARGVGTWKKTPDATAEKGEEPHPARSPEDAASDSPRPTSPWVPAKPVVDGAATYGGASDVYRR